MPDLIRDDLVLRALLHKADALALLALVQRPQRSALEEDLPPEISRRGEDGLELPQQGALSAAGGAAKGNELPPGDGEGEMGKGILPLLRIGEAQVPDRKCFNFTSSLPFRINGVRHKAR